MSLASLLGRAARLFYRRIEVTGLEHVPPEGPVLLVANHANGLVDPMIVLALVSRPITFVAKSTLWKIPLLGSALDSLGAVPVVRRVDVAEEGEGARRNEESLARLAAALDAGRAVLIFPEGRSHSEPALSPIRTGAARMLLAAHRDVAVVPVGLWFARKEEFRSDVLAEFGAPLNPEERSVAAWTRAIEEGLRGVTLNAESWAEHEAVSAVEAIYGERLPAEGAPGGLERSFRNRRLLLEARKELARVEPEAVARLARRARAYRRLAVRAGVDPATGAEKGSGVAARLAGLVALSIVRLPLVAVGIVAFWVPYRLTGVVTEWILRGVRQRDQIALWKMLTGAALHAAALGLEAGAIGYLLGPLAALGAVLLLPACGLFALDAVEETERDVAALRARLLARGASRGAALLARERDELVAECDRLGAVYAALSASAAR